MHLLVFHGKCLSLLQTPENSLRRENILQAIRQSPEGTAESCVNSGSSNVWLIKYKKTFPSNLLLLILVTTNSQQIQPEKSRESQESMLWERGATMVISKCANQVECVGRPPQNTNEAYIANLGSFRKYLKIGVLARLIACLENKNGYAYNKNQKFWRTYYM